MIFAPTISASLEKLNIYAQSGVALLSTCLISPFAELRTILNGQYADSALTESFIGSYSFMAPGEYKSLFLGNYCHLGERSKTLGIHPIDRVSDSIFSYTNASCISGFNSKLFFNNFPMVLVGHNVWVGNDVSLKNGVIIGHGAVIEDGTVVTKHVPPYAIVAGTPGKVVGMRYTAEQRQRMDKLKWWRYDWQNVPLNWCDVDACLDGMEQALAQQDSQHPKIPEFNCSFKIVPKGNTKVDITKDELTWDIGTQRVYQTCDLYEILAMPEHQPHVLKI